MEPLGSGAGFASKCVRDQEVVGLAPGTRLEGLLVSCDNPPQPGPGAGIVREPRLAGLVLGLAQHELRRCRKTHIRSLTEQAISAVSGVANRGSLWHAGIRSTR